MQDTVKVDRDKYVGGSDIPAILGLSNFKTRYELILDKAGLYQDDFDGNMYTDYGNRLEPIIRKYVNDTQGYNFVEDKAIITTGKGLDIRCHCDGIDLPQNCILEIKTTGKLYKTLNNKKYKGYLSQLLFYMYTFGIDNGILAVYQRPVDLYNNELSTNNLQLWRITRHDYQKQLDVIIDEVDAFIDDVQIAKDNILVTPQDFKPQKEAF